MLKYFPLSFYKLIAGNATSNSAQNDEVRDIEYCLFATSPTEQADSLDDEVDISEYRVDFIHSCLGCELSFLLIDSEEALEHIRNAVCVFPRC